MTWQILYNPKAGNGRGKAGAEKLKDVRTTVDSRLPT